MTTLGWFFIIAGVVWLLCAVAVVAIFHTDAANDEAWEAERPDALDAVAEWRAMVGTLDAFVAEVTASDYEADPTPVFDLMCFERWEAER